jgi:hypothetical protein
MEKVDGSNVQYLNQKKTLHYGLCKKNTKYDNVLGCTEKLMFWTDPWLDVL